MQSLQQLTKEARRHGRVGHVFQRRYKAIIVDKDKYLLKLCRYIVLYDVTNEDIVLIEYSGREATQ